MSEQVQPKRYVEHEEPTARSIVEAIRYDGTPESAEAIRAWLYARYRAVSPYSSVGAPEVEQFAGRQSYLVLEQANGRLGVAVPGEWIVVEGDVVYRPWVYENHRFEEFYGEENEDA